MRVLMLGWEFPPYFAGGVGTVCYELTKALARKGVAVTHVMPHGPDGATAKHVKLIVTDRVGSVTKYRSRKVRSPYISREEYSKHVGGITAKDKKKNAIYSGDLLNDVRQFAADVLHVASEEEFDIIHAHDWTTLPAGVALKRMTGKPLVVHVHITEFDKTGGNHADPEIYAIEREGFHNADVVIAISKFVKRRLMQSYGVPEEKIRVVYNSVEPTVKATIQTAHIKDHDRIVLFLGRVTLQKGPDYFLEAASKVLRIMPNVTFVIAGTGDMLPRMIERAADLGIGHKVVFTGFVSREDGDRLYRSADLFVMPSVSEPFGLVPLEAMRQGTPVIVSRQSGVSEILSHALKVDFWDTDDLANKILATLNYPALHATLRHHGTIEVQRLTWDTPAEECMRIYDEACKRIVEARTW